MTEKLSEKDKKDWHKFVNSEDKLEIKDNEFLKQDRVNEKSIDLHGFTLDEANDKIFKFISYCYQNKVKKINVITGKGMRSKNLNDPYKSSNLGILKHSVPDYIKNNSELMKKIKMIDFDSVNSSLKGSFDIILKKKL